MLSTIEGGRKTSPLKNYRPDWIWPGSEMMCGARIFSDISLGETKEVIIEPLVQENWNDVSIGTQLTVHEGLKVVGRGEVLDII